MVNDRCSGVDTGGAEIDDADRCSGDDEQKHVGIDENGLVACNG